MSARPAAFVAAIVTVAVTAVACSGGGSGSHPTSAVHSSAGARNSTTVATRWWSNSAATTGSHIDLADPTALAAKLHSSEHDYCGMLKQTLAAGKAILPGVTAQDPALLGATRAFVAELQAVAPTSVAGSWRVLGGAVTSLVAAGGNASKVKNVDAAAVQKAAATIASDAKRSCGVDLSAAVH
jgi:hypothetical protein